MASILFAWELGGDYGHLSRLLPVALALAQRGHNPIFALRDLMGAEAILAPHQIRALQAPLWLGKVTNLPDPISYPEMLMRFGYLNARALTGICRAWRNLVDLVQPGLVVLDHAPTALLATRGLGLPRVNLGDGFCIPPRQRPMPHFRWWQRENMLRVNDSEQHALATANTVLQALDAPPLVGLGELADCDDSLFCTFAELDHYPERGPQNYIGPIYALGQGAEVRWPQAQGPRIFAYLKPAYGGLEQVLAALHGAAARVLVHAPGAARQTLARYGSAHLQFSTEPLDMDQVSASCDLALCHGGGGTTAALLLAGKPLLLFPMHTEQMMTARRLASLGVAASVVPEGVGQLPKLLGKMLANPAPAQAAQQFAQAHAGYDQRQTIALAADRCAALLGEAT